MHKGTKWQIAHKYVCLITWIFYVLSLALVWCLLHLEGAFTGAMLSIALSIAFVSPYITLFVEPLLFLATVIQAIRKTETREPFKVHLLLFVGSELFWIVYLFLLTILSVV